MADITRARRSALTRTVPFSTRETVGTETPATLATSAMTGGFIRGPEFTQQDYVSDDGPPNHA